MTTWYIPKEAARFSERSSDEIHAQTSERITAGSQKRGIPMKLMIDLSRNLRIIQISWISAEDLRKKK